VGGGRWEMGIGKWEVENGKWKMGLSRMINNKH
jgi:hypothetical protein